MNVSLGLAFLAGLASTLSPCVLPVLPTFLGWLAGVAAKDAPHRRRRILDRLGWFALSLVLTFTLTGVIAGQIGGTLQGLRWIVPVAGVVFMLWGLFLLDLVRLPYLRVRLPKAEQTGRLGAVLFGLLFTATWTPCIGPIYGTILTLAASTGSAARGGALLFVYAVGLAVPFFLLGLAAERSFRYLKAMAKYQRAFRVVAGTMVLLIGALLVSGLYMRVIGWLNVRFIDYLPFIA